MPVCLRDRGGDFTRCRQHFQGRLNHGPRNVAAHFVSRHHHRRLKLNRRTKSGRVQPSSIESVSRSPNVIRTAPSSTCRMKSGPKPQRWDRSVCDHLRRLRMFWQLHASLSSISTSTGRGLAGLICAANGSRTGVAPFMIAPNRVGRLLIQDPIDWTDGEQVVVVHGRAMHRRPSARRRSQQLHE